MTEKPSNIDIEVKKANNQKHYCELTIVTFWKKENCKDGSKETSVITRAW